MSDIVMNEMIERIARALYRANNPYGRQPTAWEIYRFDAIAAIKAMRDPTLSMIDAGNRLARQIGGIWIMPKPENAYAAMIDAALEGAES